LASIGVGGNIATESVVRARPDGYPLLLVVLSNAMNVTLYKKLTMSGPSIDTPLATRLRLPKTTAPGKLIVDQYGLCLSDFDYQYWRDQTNSRPFCVG